MKPTTVVGGKLSKKGEPMWSVQLDGKWYDAYKESDDYALRTKGNYTWAVPTDTPVYTQKQGDTSKEDRNLSIERQNACRHTANIVAAFISARPTIDTQAVDILLNHYFNLFMKRIRDGEQTEKS